MSRRDNKIADLNRHKRVDLHGVAPYLEATFLAKATTWWNGFDGYDSADRIFVHRDGHHTSHSGAASIAPAEDPVSRIIRQGGLDQRGEAQLVRDYAAHAGDRLPARARRLGIPERTLRRIAERVADKLRQIGAHELLGVA